MMDPTPVRRQPMLACTDALRAAPADVIDIDPTYMRTEEEAQGLRALTTLTSQVGALRLRVFAASGELALEHADNRTADWLARETHVDKRAAHAQQTLAEAHDVRWTNLGAAVASGGCTWTRPE